MKTKTTLFLFLITIFTSFGQPSQEKKDKIKALKVAYITEKLDLTSDEAQQFWPIYNTFDEKHFRLRHQIKKEGFKHLKGENFDNLSEKDALELLTQFEKNEDELYVAKKKFRTEIKKVLSAKKILLLKKTEDEFNRKLLKEFKGRKQ